VIEVEDVAVSLGGVAVLDGVDLSVRSGEFVALVGPNGAGKTTLIRAINGVRPPDRGTIRLDGESTSELSSRAVSRRVATVPQDTHVGFSFRAEQIVEMGRTPHRSRLDWGGHDDPVEQALERTETAALRDRTVDELSGGERQRVLLARALAQETPALVLDEPTASLDINHQLRVLSLVTALTADGKTAVAAIHDLNLAARFCDRLAVLSDGEIQATGPPRAVLNTPAVETAFDTATAVTRDPVTGDPVVTAMDRAAAETADCRVHVAGGGQPAAATVRSLWTADIEPSVGPVAENSITARLAAALEIDVVTTPPFAALSRLRLPRPFNWPKPQTPL
jgi:ABC-type cobalamin/Fe3+-siderophores transport systems, ATPase components